MSSDEPQSNDRLLRFSFDNFAVRGAAVKLHHSWLQLLERNQASTDALAVFGEAAAAVTLMFNSIKFSGRISIQLQGDSPISLMLVQASHHGQLRGVIRSTANSESSFNDLTRNSTLAITLEHDKKDQRQQGIVPLEGSSLSEALSGYFVRSEQIESKIVLAANDQYATGLILQAMPLTGGHQNDPDPDGWNRISQLAATLTREELLTLTPETVLHRLFHEEQLQSTTALPVSFGCSCSQNRVTNMLLGLGKKETMAAVNENGFLTVDCQFCNQQYRLDKVDIEQLFKTQRVEPAPPQRQ